MGNHAKQREAAKQPEVMTPREWFVKPGAELVTRRADVWALLGWYHHTVVEPRLSLRGNLRRLWWRITGQHARLLDPWSMIIKRREEIALDRAARAALGRELAGESEPNEPDTAAGPKIIS